MADIKKFEIPDFLKNESEEEIHKEMLEVISKIVPDMDLTEGSVAWDFTRPTAKEKSRMVNFNLIELIKNFFPMWAYSDNLDNLAFTRGIERKPAVKATGTVTVTGKTGTIIPDGFQFSTEAEFDISSVLFAVVGTHTIEDEGDAVPVDIPVVAVNPGKSGNVAAGKIMTLTKPIKNIASVTNEDPTTGGVDQESDEDLRQRIVDYDQAQGVSYVGSVSDYTRWAMEVTGVGAVKVIPANNGTGIVKLVITDANGAPASAELCTSVFEHIMSPGIPALRIAPVNSQLIVVPPETLRISISAKIVNESGVGIQAVRNDLLTVLGEYYKTAMVNGVVRYNEIGGILIDIPGVADYGNLMVNGGNANLSLDEDIMPLTEIADLSGVII